MIKGTRVYSDNDGHKALCSCGFEGKTRRWKWLANLGARHHMYYWGCRPEYRLGG